MSDFLDLLCIAAIVGGIWIGAGAVLCRLLPWDKS